MLLRARRLGCWHRVREVSGEELAENVSFLQWTWTNTSNVAELYIAPLGLEGESYLYPPATICALGHLLLASLNSRVISATAPSVVPRGRALSSSAALYGRPTPWIQTPPLLE